jgi:hypothetical protein
MPNLNPAPDVLDFAPSLVVLLRDGFTGANALAGGVTVKIGASTPLVPNPAVSTFVFVKLSGGNYAVNVQSTPDTPYYLPAEFVVKLPFPRPAKSLWPQPPIWTGYPDLVLADPAKLLDDPEQTAAYRAQREETTLLPTTSYPFPAGSTLVRGIVIGGGALLAGALVTSDLVAQAGQFAVTVVNPSGPPSAAVNLRALTTPVTDSLEPAVVLAGISDFELNVTGSGFDSGALAEFDGASLPTTVMSDSFLTAQVTASQVAAAGTHIIMVKNASGTTSNPQTLTVAAAPAIDSISPATVAVGSAAFSLSVQGSGFAADSLVKLNGASLATTFVSSSMLAAWVPAVQLAAAGALSLLVAPGAIGQNSNTQTLIVVNTPVISSLEPASTIAGTAAFSLTVNGTGFVAGSTVSINGIAVAATATTFVSPAQLLVQVTAAQIANAAQLQIAVTNPPAAGSNKVNLTVAAAPQISSIDPATVTADSGAFTILVTGSGFMPGAEVQLNGVGLQTTVLNSQTLHAFIPRNGYTTGSDGAFVLFFNDIQGRSQTETLVVTHPSYPNPKRLDVTVLRGITVSVEIDMSS